VAGHAASEHGAVEQVERGEQGGDAVADIVVGLGARLAGLERQTGLGAIERLDLGLLVDRQDDRMLRPVDVQADDVLELWPRTRGRSSA
jgi:hypothetical protein